MLDIQIVYSVCADTMIPTSYELLSPGTGESHCALPVRHLGVTCGPIPFGRPFWSRCVALPAFRCRSFPSATLRNLRSQNDAFFSIWHPACFFFVICSIFWPLREARCDMQYFLFPIRVEWEGGCDLGHCGGHKFVSWIKTGLPPVVDWVSAELRSLSLIPHKSTKTERNEVQLWLRYRLQVALIAVPISIFSPMQITCLSPVASLDR